MVLIFRVGHCIILLDEDFNTLQLNITFLLVRFINRMVLNILRTNLLLTPTYQFLCYNTKKGETQNKKKEKQMENRREKNKRNTKSKKYVQHNPSVVNARILHLWYS